MMKIFRKEVLSSTSILFVIGLIYFFIRTCLTPLAYDDYSYSFIWDGEHGGNLFAMQTGSPEIEAREKVTSINDICRSLWSHYFTWGGRIIAHFFVQLFLWLGKPLFNLANTLVFAMLILIILHLSGVKWRESLAPLMWIFLSIFVLLNYSLDPMIWLTGACNYLWMATVQLLFLVPYVDALRGKNFSMPLIIALGLLAGCANESGALVTILLTIFLIALCRVKKILQPWMLGGLISSCIGCAIMLFAPGNFARLVFAHPNFNYSAEYFLTQIKFFIEVAVPQIFILIPMLIYFWRRKSMKIDASEILMISFAVAGMLVPIVMIFSPEYSISVAMNSTAFDLVASSIAIAQIKPQLKNSRLTITATIFVILYLASIIYVDATIFLASRQQAEFIRSHSNDEIIYLPPLDFCHKFEQIHGFRSAAPFLQFFGGIQNDPNSCRNLLIAQYYGVKKILQNVDHIDQH